MLDLSAAAVRTGHSRFPIIHGDLDETIGVVHVKQVFAVPAAARSTTKLSDLAQTVDDTGGAVFLPALAGLGAPYWDDSATGTITGMTHGTTPAHLARAALEAIAHQIADF